MPSFTIEGNPDGVLARATTMVDKATSFDAVADGLESVTTDGWVGRAADRFRDKFDTEPDRWRDAAAGFRRAGQSLQGYAEALRSAQARARWAEGEYARGDQVTADARAAWEADVAQARQEVAQANAAGTPTVLTIIPFQDPGAAIRKGALDELAAARSDLRAAAQACAAEVRAGCAAAPEKRNWLETGAAFVGGVFKGAGEAVWDLVEMGHNLTFGPLYDLIDVARGDLTMEELAAKYQLRGEQAMAIWNSLREDPLQFGQQVGKALLDWDTWADDPARALGRLVPDAVATIASGGAGASMRALRGLEGLHDISLLARPLHGFRALDGMNLHDLTGLSRLDDAALAARIDSLSVEDQARLLRRGEDLTPQQMSDIFNERRYGPTDFDRLANTYEPGSSPVRQDHPVDGPLVNLHGSDPGSGIFWTDPAELLATRTETQAMDRMALRPEWYTSDAPGGGYSFDHRDAITVREFSSGEDMRMEYGPIGPQSRADAVAGWSGSSPAPDHYDGAPVDYDQPGGATQYLAGLDDGGWNAAAPTWNGPAPWVEAVPDGAQAWAVGSAVTAAAGSTTAGAAADQ